MHHSIAGNHARPVTPPVGPRGPPQTPAVARHPPRPLASRAPAPSAAPAVRAPQEGLKYRLDDASVCDDSSEPPGIYLPDNMWSPRRNHRALSVDDRIYVLGGRARHVSDMSPERTVGGMPAPRVENDPFYSTWHEPSVLKNDVWASDDRGFTWFMITPGCDCPQREDVLAGHPDGGRFGSPGNACSRDDDCYGAGECVDLGRERGGGSYSTCVCPMWSPRELHAAAVHNDVIYVVGGFASVRESRCGDFACGDVDAAAYRAYKSDVWYSLDGEKWEAATLDAGWPGRGDHGIFVHSDALYVVGGAGDGGHGRMAYMNDVWKADLPDRCRASHQGRRAPHPSALEALLVWPGAGCSQLGSTSVAQPRAPPSFPSRVAPSGVLESWGVIRIGPLERLTRSLRAKRLPPSGSPILGISRPRRPVSPRILAAAMGTKASCRRTGLVTSPTPDGWVVRGTRSS